MTGAAIQALAAFGRVNKLKVFLKSAAVCERLYVSFVSEWLETGLWWEWVYFDVTLLKRMLITLTSACPITEPRDILWLRVLREYRKEIHFALLNTERQELAPVKNLKNSVLHLLYSFDLCRLWLVFTCVQCVRVVHSASLTVGCELGVWAPPLWKAFLFC